MSKVIATSRQRVSDFLEPVNKQQAKIRTLGDKAWLKTPSTGEVEIIRQFLSKPDCGTALLNRELAPLLSRDGWVVKFASIFLHQKPKVEGWKEPTRGPTSALKIICDEAFGWDTLTLLWARLNSPRT